MLNALLKRFLPFIIVVIDKIIVKIVITVDMLTIISLMSVSLSNIY